MYTCAAEAGQLPPTCALLGCGAGIRVKALNHAPACACVLLGGAQILLVMRNIHCKPDVSLCVLLRECNSRHHVCLFGADLNHGVDSIPIFTHNAHFYPAGLRHIPVMLQRCVLVQVVPAPTMQSSQIASSVLGKWLPVGCWIWKSASATLVVCGNAAPPG